jgi:hypothetical protein
MPDTKDEGCQDAGESQTGNEAGRRVGHDDINYGKYHQFSPFDNGFD